MLGRQHTGATNVLLIKETKFVPWRFPTTESGVSLPVTSLAQISLLFCCLCAPCSGEGARAVAFGHFIPPAGKGGEIHFSLEIAMPGKFVSCSLPACLQADASVRCLGDRKSIHAARELQGDVLVNFNERSVLALKDEDQKL